MKFTIMIKNEPNKFWRCRKIEGHYIGDGISVKEVTLRNVHLDKQKYPTSMIALRCTASMWNYLKFVTNYGSIFEHTPNWK